MGKLAQFLKFLRNLPGYTYRSWRFVRFLIISALLAGTLFVAWEGIKLARDLGNCLTSPIECVTKQTGPQKDPAIVLEESNKTCLEILAADDGQTRVQHMFWIHAALNQADSTAEKKDGKIVKEGLTICQIHISKRTLKAPSQYGSAWPRMPKVAGALDNNDTTGDTANVAAAKLEVERILKNRKADYKEYPCLEFVMGGIRPWKWGTFQRESVFKREMTLLYVDGDARFYGPKGSKACTK